MDDQLFENLAKKYPDLFKKAQVEHFECDNGWYNILDVLCGLLNHPVSRAREHLKWVQERRDGENVKETEFTSIPIAEKKLADALEQLPSISQVKEKFAGLRFYVDGGTNEAHNYISFAEDMSMVTCEECGAPGEIRNTGWAKVRCAAHHRQHELVESLSEPTASVAAPKRFETKLSDET